jgi:hypothetical protein
MKHFVERGFHLLSRLLAKKHCALVGNLHMVNFTGPTPAQETQRAHMCCKETSPPKKKQMKKKHVGATGPAMFPVRFHKLAYFLLAENERITCTSDLVSHDLVDVGGFL